MNNKKNLKMKPVGSEYMEQYNALLRYVFQVTEQELSSIGWQEREIIRAKFPTMEKADVIGWFDNDACQNLWQDLCNGRSDRSRHLSGVLQHGTDA